METRKLTDDDRARSRSNFDIYADVLVNRARVNGSGSLMIPAPAGIQVNADNGTVRPSLTIVQAGDPVITNTTVLINKVAVNGFITINVFANGTPVPSLQGLQIPFHDIINAPGVTPNATINVDNFFVNGFTYSGVVVQGTAYLIFTAAYSYEVTVTVPRVLNVNATDVTSIIT